MREVFAELSEMRSHPIALFAAGDYVVSAARNTGHHDQMKQSFAGWGATIYRIVDGRVKESWSFAKLEEPQP
jgi:hypothetical protein